MSCLPPTSTPGPPEVPVLLLQTGSPPRGGLKVSFKKFCLLHNRPSPWFLTSFSLRVVTGRVWLRTVSAPGAPDRTALSLDPSDWTFVHAGVGVGRWTVGARSGGRKVPKDLSYLPDRSAHGTPRHYPQPRGRSSFRTVGTRRR